MILALCDRFGCLPWPGSLMEQPARLLRMVQVEALARPPDPEPGVPGG